MAYRLKSIRYLNESHHILLQNENGPCPLLAAANVLLLKKAITLPRRCVGSGVVTIEELTNLLAEKILNTNHGQDGSDHHINEVMKIFPNLQFGMDVNPKFTEGPKGVEYTLELNAFDLLRIDLVHGWLLEPDAQEYEFVGNNTYNQLVNLVIDGNDAGAKLQQQTTDDDCEYDELSNKATRGTIIQNFLDRSAHQLTQHGLDELHVSVKDGDLVVFFRNNHYNTLTKNKDNLYLLVTDFGYADVKSVVWEKLDVIDGDTEYVNAEFIVPPPINHHVSKVATGEQLMANNAQSQADYQLALQLSRETSQPSNNSNRSSTSDVKGSSVQREQSDVERAIYASLSEHETEKPAAQNSSATASNSSNAGAGAVGPTIAVGVPMPDMSQTMPDMSQEERDMELAMQLQRQEERLQERARQQMNAARQQSRAKPSSKDSNCVIS